MPPGACMPIHGSVSTLTSSRPPLATSAADSADELVNFARSKRQSAAERSCSSLQPTRCLSVPPSECARSLASAAVAALCGEEGCYAE